MFLIQNHGLDLKKNMFLTKKYSENSDNGRIRKIQKAKIILNSIICIRTNW